MTIVGVRAGAMVLLMAGAWSLYVATSASASTTNGTATIIDPGTNNPLPSGGSSTTFTVTLPAQAACTGDTATGGYHVFSYLVPQGTSPSTINFSTGDPSTGYGFFTSTPTYYGAINTAVTTGQIIGIPDFEWGPAVQGDSLLTSLLAGGGVWEGGIACANSSGVVTDWWNTEITFTASTSDPDGFIWSAVAGPPGGGSPTTTTTTAGTTTTTAAGSTTTTTAGTTTTTAAGSTTSTTTGSSTTGSSTTTAGSATPASAATQSGSSTDGDSASTDPGSTSATGGTLASTGAPIVRDFALGLLCIGLGLILLGWSAWGRLARAGIPTGVRR